LSALRIPEILQAAATSASGAALIVVASRIAELSAATVYCIRRLIKHRKSRNSALVLLIHGRSEASPAFVYGCALMRRAAREAGMAFFCGKKKERT
jgi:hypothetical protein